MASRLDFSQIRSLYVGTSSSTQVDTNNLIVVGNVGIGTTAPDAKLVVVGQGTGLGKIGDAGFGSGNYTGISLNGTLSTTNYNILSSTTDSTLYINRPSGASIAFREANGGNQVSIISGGNVGIGTTSPSHKLNVAADGYNLRLANTSNAQGYNIGRNISDGYLYFYGDEASYDGYIFSGVGGEKMRITSAGNVGIGTTSPSTKLEVGNFLDAVTNKITVAARYEYEPEFNFRLGQSGTNLDWIGAVISSGDDGNYNGKILFKTANAGRDTPTTKMVIKANGNVGIGTTSPTYKLQVNGDSYVGGNLTSTGYGFFNGEGLGTSIRVGGIYGNLGLYVASTYDMQFDLGWDGVFKFTRGNTERMRITAAGNVGIGTTAPSRTLSVGGTNAYMDFKASSFRTYTIGSDGNGFIVFDDNASAYRMVVNPSGNVGIGTTSPSYKLQVNGEGNGLYVIGANSAPYTQTIAKFVYGGNNNSINIENQAGKASFQARDNSDAAMSLLLNPVAGSVLIGTGTDAGYKLDVNGTVRALSVGVIQASSNSDTPNIAFTNNGTSFTWGTIGGLLQGDGDGALFFSTKIGGSVTEKMRITSAGNVGIGTTAPASKLHVSVANGTNDAITIDSPSTNNIVIGGLATGVTYIRSFEGSFEIGNSFSGGDLRLKAGNAEAMRITSAGNVGIGTTAPSANLEVYAGSNSTANTILWGQTIRNAGNAATTGYGVGLKLKNSTDSVPNELYKWAGIASVAGANYSNRTDLAFYTNNDSVADPTEKVRITGDGNLGIGTIAPGVPLSVAGIGGSTKGTNGYLVNIGGTDGNVDPVRYMIGFSHGNTYTAANVRAAVGMMVTTGGAGNLVFETGSSGAGQLERMRINGSGDVGIGTTAPSKKFVVRSADNTTNTFAGFYAENESQGVEIWYAGIQAGGSNGNVSLHLASKGTGDVVVTNGNVGIGTTSPTEKLHVDGSVVVTYNNSYQGINSVGNKAILARVSPTTGIINYAEYATATNLNGFVMGSDDARVKGNIATDSLEFITNGSTQVTVLSNGNVGIANTNPSEKLSVTGNIRMDNGAADGPQLVLGSSGFSDWNIDNYSGSLRAYYGSTEYTRLTSSGNFGIGVSPSYKLDVAGDTRITSGSLGVGVVPNATDGRIDASNDIVAYSSSDRRLKENITPIANALDKVKSLTGVEFDWKPEHKKAHGYEGHDTGVIAQEVQEVMPTAVRTNDTGYLAVRYEKMIGLLIEAMKEQQTQIDELKAKLDGLTK